MLSFWEKNSFLNYDIIIIGSGILGLSTACEIKERFPDKNILVLERGILPTGASTKNAGFLCFGSLTEILADIEIKGTDNAISLVEKRWAGINYLKQRLSENKIGYYNFGGFDLLDELKVHASSKIEYVNDLLKGIFKNNVFELRNNCIKKFGFNSSIVKQLIYSPYESQVDTGEMMKTLLKYTQFLGIQIINGADVKEIHNGKVKVWHSFLNEQVTFNAEKVIICANAFAEKLYPELNIKPGRGQVIITKPINKLKLKGIFHFDEGYYYFRNYGDRVILGGGRNLDFTSEETFEFNYNDMILKDLVDKLDNMILPNIKYEIEDKWTGIMGFTEHKLPMVKEIDRFTIAAVSCNGMGVALSSYIAREIVNKLN